MNSLDVIERINNEPDFINVKRVGYSLKRLMEKYHDGVPDRIIATALNITEDEVEQIYQDVIRRLRENMGA